MNKIGFIGAGNMATAIINGMLTNNVASAKDINVFDLDQNKLSVMAEKGINACATAKQVAQQSHFVVLAVKPQNYAEVLDEIKDAVTDSTVMVSIAAGISINYVVSSLNAKCACVRVMPNTPLLLGCGATALCPSENIADKDFAVVKSMFAISGIVEVLPESQMNTVIAVNGSSPAFIYLFAKGFLDYAKEVGISEEAAKQLFAQSLIGSAAMLTDSGYDVDTLIQQVSSPGGTTLAGLDALYEGKLEDTVKDACRRCTKRAYELSK